MQVANLGKGLSVDLQGISVALRQVVDGDQSVLWWVSECETLDEARERLAQGSGSSVAYLDGIFRKARIEVSRLSGDPNSIPSARAILLSLVDSLERS